MAVLLAGMVTGCFMLIVKTDKLLPLVSLSQDKSSGTNTPMITELGKDRSLMLKHMPVSELY